MVRLLSVFSVSWLLSTGLSAEPLGTITGGQECSAVNERQAASFERRENGFWNVDTKSAYWVICPLKRPVSAPETSIMPCPTLVVSGRSEVEVDVTCHFREVSVTGDIIWAFHEKKTMTSGTFFGCAFGWPTLEFRLPKDRFSSFSVACLLPPNTGITQLVDWWLIWSSED